MQVVVVFVVQLIGNYVMIKGLLIDFNLDFLCGGQ